MKARKRCIPRPCDLKAGQRVIKQVSCCYSKEENEWTCDGKRLEFADPRIGDPKFLDENYNTSHDILCSKLGLSGGFNRGRKRLGGDPSKKVNLKPFYDR